MNKTPCIMNPFKRHKSQVINLWLMMLILSVGLLLVIEPVRLSAQPLSYERSTLDVFLTFRFDAPVGAGKITQQPGSWTYYMNYRTNPLSINPTHYIALLDQDFFIQSIYNLDSMGWAMKPQIMQWISHDTLAIFGEHTTSGRLVARYVTPELQTLQKKIWGDSTSQRKIYEAERDREGNYWLTSTILANGRAAISVSRLNPNLDTLSTRLIDKERIADFTSLADEILVYPSADSALITVYNTYWGPGRDSTSPSLANRWLIIDTSFNVIGNHSTDGTFGSTTGFNEGQWLNDSTHLILTSYSSYPEGSYSGSAIGALAGDAQGVENQLVFANEARPGWPLGHKEYPNSSFYDSDQQRHCIASTAGRKLGGVPLRFVNQKVNTLLVFACFINKGDQLRESWLRYHADTSLRANILNRDIIINHENDEVAFGSLKELNRIGAQRKLYIARLDTFGYPTDYKVQTSSSTSSLSPRPLRARPAPNPSAGPLRLQGNFRGPVRVTLYDAQGRPVARRRLRSTQGRATLSLPQLPAGLYTFRLQDAQGRQTTGRWMKKE
jgi:hypothetical protein